MSKVKFISAGSVNVIFTVFILQSLLAYSVPVWLSTLLAQLFNVAFGFSANSRYVFRSRRASMQKYAVINLSLWLLNAALIQLLSLYDKISVNIASAIILIPIGVFSYVAQKTWVFNENSNC